MSGPQTKQYGWLSGRFDHREVVILSRGLFGWSNISLGFRVYKGPSSRYVVQEDIASMVEVEMPISLCSKYQLRWFAQVKALGRFGHWQIQLNIKGGALGCSGLWLVHALLQVNIRVPLNQSHSLSCHDPCSQRSRYGSMGKHWQRSRAPRLSCVPGQASLCVHGGVGPASPY